MKKRAEQTLLTKEKLTNAFWQLYEQKPYNQVTVRDITELAGYNRSTFYTYFKDVYDVLEQTEDDICQMFDDEFERSRYLGDKEEVTESIRIIGEFLEKNRKRMMLLLGKNGDAKFLHRMMQQMRDKMRARLSGVIDKNDQSFDYVVEYIINAHIGLTVRWFQSGCSIPFEQMVELIYRLTAGGLVAVLTESDAILDQAAAIFKLNDSGQLI